MEWVETTAKTVDEAKERVLDQLGVARDEADFEVLDEPKSGLFGLLRGEARVRGRVRPAAVRPKQDRRKGRGNKSRSQSNGSSNSTETAEESSNGQSGSAEGSESGKQRSGKGRSKNQRNGGNRRNGGSERKESQAKEQNMEPVSPQEVGDAAVTFMDGLVEAFGATGSSSLTVDGTELDVVVDGNDLGLLVGPGGRTLNAVQDLARVAAQRRLGDHDTRLRIDVGGYRERRRAALEAFTRKVAAEVIETGTAKALEPMASADRKVVHDTVNEMDGVESRSDGDDPARRVVIAVAAD